MRVSIKDIHNAYKRCHKGKAKSIKAQVYSAKLLDNLWDTHLVLHTNTYTAKPYTTFVAKNGSKPREIYASDFSDRVVHHYLVPQLEKIINHKFIYHSCANQIGKGTHFGVNTLQKMLRQITNTTKVVSPKQNRISDFSPTSRGSDFSRLEIQNHTTKVVSPKYNRGSDFSRLVLKENTTKTTPQKINKQDFKKLPHINIINTYQFITFRTKDSVDDFVKKISNQNIDNKNKYQQIDDYLDNSNKGCYLNYQVINKLKDFFIGKKDIYELIALSIMPNHIHILFKQTKDLAKTMQSLKGGSAIIVNKTLGKTGSLWEKGYYDKGIRDEKQFKLTYSYIKNNAGKAGLKDADIRFYGIYEESKKIKGSDFTPISRGSDFTLISRGSDFSRLEIQNYTTKVVSPKYNKRSDFSRLEIQSYTTNPKYNRGSDFSRLVLKENTTKIASPTQNYYLQLDIFNFFYSIDKKILLNILAKHLKIAIKQRKLNINQARDYYRLCAQILQKPQATNNLNKQQLQEIAPHKQLKNIEDNKGLPIGNLTSQFFGNVYMNELDQFIKHKLKVKYFVRFVDDFVLLGSKPQLQQWLEQIKVFLKSNLALKLKQEIILKPIDSGVDFLGYIIYPHYKLVRSRVIHNFYKKLQLWQQNNILNLKNGKLINLDYTNLNLLNSLFASYIGHIKHAKHYKILQNKIKQFPWLQLFFYNDGDKYKTTSYNKNASKFKHQQYFFNTTFTKFVVLIQKGNCFIINTNQNMEFSLKHLTATLKKLQANSQSYVFISEQGFVHNKLKQRKLKQIFISHNFYQFLSSGARHAN